MSERGGNPPIAKSEKIVVTPPGRMLWPNLFKEDKLQGQFTATLVVDPEHPDWAEFAAAIKAFSNKAFADGGKPANLSWPIRLGDKFAGDDKKMSDAAREVIRGNMVVVAKSKFAPNVSVLKGGQYVRIEGGEAQSMVYSGMVASMAGTLEAYSGRFPAIVMRLQEVAKIANADKIGGRDPNAVFGHLKDLPDASVGADNSGGDLDDEIPF